MDIPGTFKVLPVVPLTLACQAFLHKTCRHIQEDIQIGTGQAEVTVFCIQYPPPQLFGTLIIGHLGALVSNVGIYVAVQQQGTAST